MISASLAAVILAPQANPRPIRVKLAREERGLDFEGSAKAGLMYRPSVLQLAPPDPGDGLKLPPGVDLVGSLNLGNGDDGEFWVGLKPSAADSRLFVDFNQNKDLTDDQPAEWKILPARGEGGTASWRGTSVFQASYSQGRRKWRAPYGLNFSWTPGRTTITYFRATRLVGEVQVGGRKVQIRVHEDGNDGVFSRRFDTVEDPLQLPGVALVLDEARRDPRGTFDWEGVNYLAELSPDGGEVVLRPTVRVVKAPPRPTPPPAPLLAAGTQAPDFTVDSFEGGSVKLSDYRGKVVVLKFWATWCGPCKASMPHYQQLYTKTKGQDVALLAVCVSDERPAFQTWVTENRSRYTFPFFFDPAGRAEGQSISRRLFNVTGIPTVFIIDKEGKVSQSVVGYSEGDRRVDDALAKLGVTGL